MYMHDAAVLDAGSSGLGGSAGKGAAGQAGARVSPMPASGAAGAAGSSNAGSGGAPNDPWLAGTDLRVSDVLGFYNGDWGEMVLQKRDTEIWGVYRYNDGTIIGEINTEGVFAGWWSQLPTRLDGINAGEVEFRWSRSSSGGIALDGRWRYGTSTVWRENWDVGRSDAAAPSDLLERFSDTDDFRRHP